MEINEFLLWFEADEIAFNIKFIVSMEIHWLQNKSNFNFKKHEKTVIFLIFADIKRHSFKYIGQFLIKFGHNNIES